MAKKGTVIKVFIYRTHPPKIKYFIILGHDQIKRSYACIFINSEINIHVLNTSELQALQHPLLKEKNAFLDHNSFANCADIFLKDSTEINQLMNDPDIYKAEIHPDDINTILEIVKHAETTKPNYLKVFNF